MESQAHVAHPAMDKVVVITGASSGIGAALAELLAQREMSVVLAARRRQALEAVAAKCRRVAAYYATLGADPRTV